MITIDFPAGLAKARADLDNILPHIGMCTYSAPCVIGAMLSVDQRIELDEHRRLPNLPEIESRNNSYKVSELVRARKIIFTDPRHAELADRLQCAFDDGDSEDRDYFMGVMMRIEQEVASLP